MKPKEREPRTFKEKNNVGPVLDRSAVETPHFSREVAALGLMRNSGAEVLPLRTKWRRS